MGGSLAKKQIAQYNAHVDERCNYCKDAVFTFEHIRWACPFFNQTRTDTDPELAKVPIKYLRHCIQCGIAPAMKTDGNHTYWGQHLDDDDSKNARLGNAKPENSETLKFEN